MSLHPHLNLHTIDAAIIDLDGTLVDTLGDFTVALNAMLAQLRLPAIEASVVGQLVGKGSEHLIRAALRHVLLVADGDGDANADAVEALYAPAWQRYQAHYLQINGRHATVYPGVLQGLDAMRRRGWKLACLTNKPAAFARPLLAAKGLDHYFSHLFGGDAFERKKPDPLPVRKTCEALGKAPARTLVIGDSGNDAQAARAAGCPVVLVTYGYNHGRPVRAEPADGFVDSLAELAKLAAGG